MLKYSGWGAGGASPQIRGGSCCTSLSPGTMAQGGLCPSAFLRYRMQHLSCFGTSRSRSLGSRTAKTTARPICEGRRSAPPNPCASTDNLSVAIAVGRVWGRGVPGARACPNIRAARAEGVKCPHAARAVIAGVLAVRGGAARHPIRAQARTT